MRGAFLPNVYTLSFCSEIFPVLRLDESVTTTTPNYDLCRIAPMRVSHFLLSCSRPIFFFSFYTTSNPFIYTNFHLNIWTVKISYIFSFFFFLLHMMYQMKQDKKKKLIFHKWKMNKIIIIMLKLSAV